MCSGTTLAECHDVLLIDAQDLQANIDGGDGFDIAQVVGTQGVTVNLA
jgi:hypothetical protein